MEPLTMFASTVGFVGVFHLLSQAVERFGAGKEVRTGISQQRRDWYCFFQLSDLLGTSPEGIDAIKTARDSAAEAERLEQRRRQHANRPRLHA